MHFQAANDTMNELKHKYIRTFFLLLHSAFYMFSSLNKKFAFVFKKKTLKFTLKYT